MGRQERARHGIGIGSSPLIPIHTLFPPPQGDGEAQAVLLCSIWGCERGLKVCGLLQRVIISTLSDLPGDARPGTSSS